MKTDVYFQKITSSDREARILALKNLIDKIAPFAEYKKDEFIPVKLTIGDSSCVYNVGPESVKLIVSEIKKRQAKPFLFDTSVIYKGERQNTIDHLNLAHYKGFSHSRVGAPFIIADGLLGQDGKEHAINSEYIKKIKVPSFVGMLDSLLVLSHATGHIFSVYAGAIKNVAMGMVCRATKQVQHSSLKPSVIAQKCTACGCCIMVCPVSAIAYIKEKASINQGICIGCGECLCACKFDAISINWDEDVDVFCKRMVEVCNFILSRFKNKFFINFVYDIAEGCDCESDKKAKMLSCDIGILASSDILSVDKATVDLINENTKSSLLQRKKEVYEKMFAFAKRIGLGNLEYNLVKA